MLLEEQRSEWLSNRSKNTEKKRDCVWDDERNQVSKRLVLWNVEWIGLGIKQWSQREMAVERTHKAPGWDLGLETVIGESQDPSRISTEGRLTALTIAPRGARSLVADRSLSLWNQEKPICHSCLGFAPWCPFSGGAFVRTQPLWGQSGSSVL